MPDIDTLHRIANANRSNPYADIIPFALGVGFPVIHYSGIVLQKEEVIIYVSPASIYKDKEKVVGYTGSSGGVSVRVAKGVSVRTGRSGGRAIRNNIREFTNGELVITNKRIVFITSKNGFEMKIDKISAIKLLSKDSFTLQSGNTVKNFRLNEALNFYVNAIIGYVTDYNTRGEDLYQDYIEVKNNPSFENNQLCEETRRQIGELKIKTNKKSNFKKIFGILIVAGIGIAVINSAVNSKNAKDSQQEVQKELHQAQNQDIKDYVFEYTDKELILMEDHPRIFDELSSVKSYVDQLGDNRVCVVYTQYGKTQTVDGEEPPENAVVTYHRHSSNDNYVGEFEIEIKDREFSSEISIEKAVEIALSYLPQNFKELYKCDKAYMVEKDSDIAYIYSTRLNEKGIEYHNDGNYQFSNYLSFYIYHYKGSNAWEIRSDYSAYGGSDIGWIEKYTTPWDINIVDN